MLDFKNIEKEILEFWEKSKIYEKIKKKNANGKKFYFLQGPPFTSGKLHIGHAWNNSLKDMAMRYKRMNGFDVWDRAGYDMHGLPTENAVQKKKGFKSKKEIEQYGIDKFIKECMDFSIEYAGYMNTDLWKLGIWMDFKDPYMPIKKEFIDGEWAFFQKAWKQKRLYKGEKVMHWDAETETSLAKHELEYKTVKDDSVFLKFKKKNSKNEFFIIWTTTPWTIPYNLAIMVNPELHYVKVKVDNEIWIIAKDLANVFVSALLGKKLEILKEIRGDELEGQEYEHIFYNELKDVYDDLKKKWKNVHTIILNKDYVDTSAGTGLVHCAPGCGPEDQEAAAVYDIGAFNTLDERGRLENMGKYSGWTAKDDDAKFIEEFEKKNVLVEKTQVEHEYPHSWRSHKPVVFRTTEQWFLKINDLVDDLLDFNKKVHWIPEKSGESYDRWAENLRDNSVTRQRFWGCPVPIWINKEDPEDYFVIGGVEELEKLSGSKFDDLKLHRPWIDEIIIKKDGKEYKRIPDVCDVWIDSGTVSWNCLFNNPELIKKYFPADLVLEATEQTKLWFSLLQICSAIMFNKSSYENVYVHGMILDYQGAKMSKSLGNIISPYEVLDKYSADIFRYYVCQLAPGENINFSWEDIKVKQKNLIVLGNIANYIEDLEKLKLKKGKADIEEKWIISRYNSALKDVEGHFREYKLNEAINDIEKLFIELSRDYIKLVREKSNNEKIVLDTVKQIYIGILKMFSTVCPFLCDSLWKRMNQKEESIHLSEWPKFDKKKINLNLEKEMGRVLKIIEMGLAERDKIKIGLKWPLAKGEVHFKDKISDDAKNIIERQLNIKKIATKRVENDEVIIKLDIKMTPELEAEGYAREFTRNIQSIRKKKGLQKTDEIALQVLVVKELKEKLEKFINFIKERTNSKKIVFVDDISGDSESFKMKEKEVKVFFCN